MTQKLTAKLSDGTEWEVLSYRGQAFGKRDGISYKDETIGLELKPLKNGPPKEVFLELPGEKEFQHIRSYSFDSTTTGGKYTRYVLADEKKEPREWTEENVRQHPLWKFLQACRVHLMKVKDSDGGAIFELWGSAHDARDWVKEEILAGRIK